LLYGEKNLPASEELLRNYHIGLNQFISSRKWLSLSANEIVERSIRSLPYGHTFKSEFDSQSLLFNKILCLILISTLSFIFVPLVLVYFSFNYYKRSKVVGCGDKVMFIRNNLSIKRFISLVNSKNAYNYTVLYDDYLGLDVDVECKNKIALSAYLPFYFYYYCCCFFKEFWGCLLDYFNNVPEKNLLDLIEVVIRIPHLILVKISLENFCKLNAVEEMSSFEMISRYSSLLNQVVEKYTINTSVGYPHGLEYDINYPNGVFGKHIYVTSKDVLSKFLIKYPTKKFEYDYNLLESLFYKKIHFKNTSEFVYFTDGRNHDLDFKNLDILKNIVKKVKLHPADCRPNYSKLELIYLDDFDDALTYGKVIVRSSTVVFEALMFGCETYCLCTNLKEIYLAKYLYPTINNSAVQKLLSLESFAKDYENV
jgi:hypothetical protein